jgi:hypothetical protein
MAIRSYSYIKKLIGERTYEDFRGYARTCIPIATIILVLLLILSQFVHWGIVSWLLNLALGTSLIFIVYVLGMILLLDFGVDVEMKEDWNGKLSLPEVMPSNYKNTIIWAYTLLVLGVTAIYFSNKYRKNYAFECQTFLVDENRGIYHLEDGNDEEDMEYTTEMKGYELEDYNYTFCESCREWVEEMESEYAVERYYRR